MSNNLQDTKDTKQTRTVLILVAAIIIGATGWYVMRSGDNANKNLDDAQKVQANADNNKQDTYKYWQGYTWEGQGVGFKYPAGWFVGNSGSDYRLYVKNTDVNLMKEETPDNFQQVWLSVDTDETSAAREAAIKDGKSDYRVVDGAVKASTIKSGDLTINAYEYNTTGGPTLEAYWTGKDGTRYMATNSTEVGQQNQTDMVATLKKLLASITQN